MATRGKFELKGLDEYLEAIQQAGIDVDEACAEAISESADILVDGMQDLVPKDTHNLEQNLGRTEPQRDGNLTFVEVGLIGGGGYAPDADTARYGNAQEYGYQRGGKFYPPRSYVRAGFDRTKGKVRAKQREVLKAKGMVD
jgi:hypothetical protein